MISVTFLRPWVIKEDEADKMFMTLTTLCSFDIK